ncbi:MAG: hypothetical protein IPH72_22665 [Sandaracinaceae bacterium]|nr:hypothetical protein [Sandaracinaceae bacterium]
MAFAAPAAAACGDFRLEVGEACDDGNVTPGDGCSAMCAVESGFVCEDVFFTLDGTGDLGVGGNGPATWTLDADNRGVIENTNSHAAVYSTILPQQVGEIVFDVRVEENGGDNDFWGWTLGYDVGELNATATPAGTDFLFFAWKQQQQDRGAADRQSGLGLTRVTGPGDDEDYWLGSGANLSMIAEAASYPVVEALPDNETTNGWVDRRWYRVNLIVTGTRVRVWIREGNSMNTTNPANRGFAAIDRVADLEFDVTTPVPPGNFGLFAYSQPQVRFDLVSPESDSMCARDYDGDGVVDSTDLDTDRDGVLDLVEMSGFTGDPDNDSDLDGISDWRDPNNVPGGCTASMGVCTSLPAALDVDGDGVPNHLDRDSDGDGLPDTLETGLTDVTADGVPDACVAVTSVGVCVAGGLAAGTLPPNTDGRGGANFLDRDSDADGIPDALEAGLTDANFNGAPDACASVTTFGLCVAGGLVGAASLPNTDMNGRPNYADRDSDGDGITDAREAGLLDANGDGVPNACTADVASGLCNAGGLAGAFPSTDSDGIVDYLDVDSDGDGLTDTIEAYDTDGNQVTNRPPVGTDTDNDGIDNAFDPDCVMAVCGGTLGAPVLGVLTAAQDANGDGTPDWLTLCGDGYRTGTEPCDDGNTNGADTCTNVCLVTLTNPCTTSPQCDSGICNTTSMTCATCFNNSPTGTDTGCNAALPACITTGLNSTCVECDVTAQCGAEVCSSSNLCEVCIDSGAGTDTGCNAGTPHCIGASGARQCVPCTTAAHCNDSVACTTDACTANACVNTPVTVGSTGMCAGGQVCSGAPTNMCVTCTDTSAMGTDSGCMAGVPHCRTSGTNAPLCEPCINSAAGSATDLGCSMATPYCVTSMAGVSSCTACLTGADCSDNNTCTTDVCTAGVCSNPTVSVGTSCTGGVCNGALPALCEACIDSGSGTDTGCNAASPHCIGASGARQCVPCTTAAHCNDSVACTTDACTANACVNTAVVVGGTGSCTGGQVCSGAPTNMCVTCTDTSAMGTDSGCMNAAPHCRTTGTGSPVCEPCINTLPGSAVDLGCMMATPYCVTGGNGANACVACLTGADCGDNNTCTTDVCTAGVCSNPPESVGTSCSGGVCDGAASALCEACIDSGSGTDTGCNAGSPHCIGVSGSRECVPCTTAAHCDDSVACTDDACVSNACTNTSVAAGDMGMCAGNEVCSGAPSDACVPCADTETNGTDAGCMNAAPFCDVSVGGSNTCEVCVDGGAGMDPGCGNGTPNCVVGSGGANECVSCIADAECSDGNECTTDVCTTGMCTNPALTEFTPCSTGVCTAASVCSMVAVTIDGPMDGTTITDPMPTLTGTGTPGTTVNVSIGGIPVGTALVDANGTWSLPLGAPLADGPHMATATVTVGQLMAEDTTGFIVDTGTVVAITEPADGSTILDSTPLIRGTGEPGATVVVSLDGNELGTVTVDMDGNWMLTVVTPLINDTYTIEAVATDDVGNMATATSTFAIASDTDVDITGPADGALITDDTPTITGTSLPNASIEVSIEIDGTDVVIGTVTANGDGVWTIDVTNPLADGPYFVTATATDLAGNMAADTSSFTVDTETFVTIETADPTTGTITGTGEPGAEVVVTIDGSPVGTVIVGQDGTWTLDTDGFDVGEHTVTATATDPAGNTATDTETVTVTTPDAGLPDAGTPDGGMAFGAGGLSGGALCATHTPAGNSWPAAAGLLLVGLALAIRRRR